MTKLIVNSLKNTISSITGIKTAKVEFVEYIKDDFFSWNQSMVYKDKFFLPSFVVNNNDNNYLLKRYRPAVDMCCSYVMQHNFKLYQDCLNYSPNIEIHNNFEKIRIIILSSLSYSGFTKNFSKIISKNLSYTDNISVLPIFLLNSFFPSFLDDNSNQYLNYLRENFDNKLISSINNLIGSISDQQKFFFEVLKIIENIQQEKIKENEDDKKEKFEQDLTKNKSFEENSIQSDKKQEKKENDKEKNDDLKNFFKNKDLKNLDEADKKDLKSKEDKLSSVKKEVTTNISLSNIADINKIEFVDHYKIYTSKYDEIIFPHKIVTKQELLKLKEQLDEKALKLTKISNSLISSFKKKLIAKKDEFLEVGSIEGIINRKKLSQLITNPFVNNILINKKLYQSNNVAVTILLDNSGSMRGKPITISALACKTLAKILEQFGIKTEIIGYTTGEWKGGRARNDWEKAGKPSNPGRLNELRHIIYKEFNQSFARSSLNLALMLKEGLLKENIDGEALIFASKRLERRFENRKIMLVISDGNPIDDSTNSANKNDLLINHLEMVIRNIEKRSRIEIMAIKIGYSNNNFYKNSVNIRDVSEVGDVMIKKVTEII